MAEIFHHIEKHIMQALTLSNSARFSEMRPKNIDSVLYNYHLKQLVKLGFIEKTDGVYRLTAKGLEYVDRFVDFGSSLSLQPKIVVCVVATNRRGEVVFCKRTRQPFIGVRCLPVGRVHLEDDSTGYMASKILRDETGIIANDIRFRGNCYIKIRNGQYYLSNVLMHVFSTGVDETKAELKSDAEWIRVSSIKSGDVMPSDKEIIELVHGSEQQFFEKMLFDM